MQYHQTGSKHLHFVQRHLTSNFRFFQEAGSGSENSRGEKEVTSVSGDKSSTKPRHSRRKSSQSSATQDGLTPTNRNKDVRDHS